MRWSQSKKYRINIEDNTQYSRANRRDVRYQKAQKTSPGRSFNVINLFFVGMKRWFVAGKYQGHRVSHTWLSKSNILWLKIGVAGFAILMVFRNDFQFTINLAGNEANEMPYSLEGMDQMGVAQTIALKPTKTTNKNRRPVKAKKVAITPRNVDDYIEIFAPVAQGEMRRFGIPASLKMALAIVASEAGKDQASQIYNNHFGRHLKGVNFDDASTNWRAHSLYLMENYPELTKAGTDYMTWVQALNKTNYYSGDQNMARQLLEVIQEYKLYQLDY
jgi:flagellum-specific peptidoglycan hydrolase FlgJ